MATIISNPPDAPTPVPEQAPLRTYREKKAIFRAYQVIWYLLALLEILLVFRVAFKMFGANASAGFVAFIYGITEPFAAPFLGIFNLTVNRTVAGVSIIEWPTLIGMIVYLLIAWGLVHLFQLVKPVTAPEVESEVDTL